MGMMQMQMQQPCSQCKGKGKVFAKQCPSCRGGRVVPEAKTFQVDVERGMKTGDTVVFERQGEQHPDMIQGDITFVIQQAPHSVFKRVGDNLYIDLQLSLEEALMGFTKQVTHLDGHQVTVSTREITQPFSWTIIKNEGMPVRGRPSDFGELHIKMLVQFPTQLSARQKVLVE